MHYPKAQTVSIIKVAASMILALVAVIMSFTTIFTINFSDDELLESYNATIEILSEEIEGLEVVEIPEEVDISASKIVSVGNAIYKIVSLVINSNPETEDDLNKYNKARQSYNEFIESEDGQTAMVTAIALMSQMGMDDLISTAESTNTEEESSLFASLLGDILLIVCKSIGILVLCVAAVLLPLLLVIFFIIDLIRVLTHLKDLGKVSGKVCSIFNKPLELGVLSILFMTLLSGVSVGSGLATILVLAIVNIVCGAVCTRLRKYNKRDLKYLNITQGTAAVEAVGGIVFFVYAQKTGIFRTFLSSFSSYVAELSSNLTPINKALESARMSTVSGSFMYFVDFLLIIIAVLAVLSFCTTAIKIIPRRLNLTTRKRGGCISIGVTGLLAGILPLVTASLYSGKFYKLNSDLSVSEVLSKHILTISSAANSALVAMIVGAALVLIAAIACKVLINIFCGDISDEEERLILSGNAPEPAEETASAPVAEAAATEKKAE